MKTIYGPVPSWRFGRSLGIDPICAKEKICSFDCVYCQLGRTKVKNAERKEYVSAERVAKELAEADKNTSDVITFSGTGEPTLNSKLGQMITSAKKYGLPVVVLTNSSLLYLQEVREALRKADIVSAKIDAPNQRLFREINRPLEGITFNSILEGLTAFRKEFAGKLALQMMFIDENRGYAEDMAELARKLEPNEVQIDTPLRPSEVRPLRKDEIDKIEEEFPHLNVISVYKCKKPTVKPFDICETRQRRPEEIQ